MSPTPTHVPTPPDPRSLARHDEQYIEWAGRIGFALKSVPDPTADPDAFAQWAANTKSQVLRGMPVSAGPLDWTWDDLWNAVNQIPGLVNLFTFNNAIAQSLEGLCADVGQVILAALRRVARTATLFWPFAGERVLLVARLLRNGAVGQRANLEALEQQVQRLEAPVRNAIQHEYQVATSGVKPPASSLKPLIDHLRLVGTVAAREGIGYSQRFVIVENSLGVLLAQMNPKLKAVQDLIDGIEAVLFNGGADDKLATALEDLAVCLVVDNNPALCVIASFITSANDPNGGFVNRLVPIPVSPGMLSDWLSGADPYEVANTSDLSDELAFRGELLAAFDRYFRTESATLGSLIRASDHRSTVAALSDLVQLLCSVAFGFVFRSDGLPSPSLPKLDFARAFVVSVRADDLAGDLAANLSRQLAFPLKSALGVALNGIWAVSPNNTPLVEAASSTIATLIQTAVEYAVRDLLGTCEVHESYDQAASDDVVYQWLSDEKYDNGKPLYYTVYRRPGLVQHALADLLQVVLNDPTYPQPILTSLLKDYVAYRAAVRAYRPLEFIGDSDRLKGTATMANGTITVIAQSTWSDVTYPSTPVVRAYYCGVPYVLTPGGPYVAGQTAQNYTGSITLAAGGRVWFVSNYGGYSWSMATAPSDAAA